jgi:predicted alpha-1,2-mannosidase
MTINLKQAFLFILFSLTSIFSQDLTSLVDPSIGSKDDGLESGYTFIGSTYPFGMIQFTPSFFSPNKGFVVTQLNGAGCSNMGNFPVLPISGEIEISPNQMDKYEKYDSIKTLRAGLLSVIMKDGTEVKLTTSKRTGFAQFKFNSKNKSSIIIGSGVNSTEVSDAEVIITSNKTAEGYATGGDFCGTETNYKIYFFIEFDRPAEEQFTWQNDNVSNKLKASGKNSGVSFVFNTKNEKYVNYKISISYVSVENAKLNMKSDGLGFDFDSYLNENQIAWNKSLNKIQVESTNKDKKVQFYSSLYRSLIHPNIVSDINGEYMGADFKVKQAKKDCEQYSSFSVWDTYRTQGQLVAWLFPKKSSDMMQSLVNFAEQAGGYGRWILANIETGIMQGDPTPILIASSYAFGAKDFEHKKAFKYMKLGATIPRLRSQNQEIRPYLHEYLRDGHTFASMSLEYNASDFAIAMFSKNALGFENDYKTFLSRSFNWKNIYNPKIKWLNSRYPNGKWKDINHDWREGTYVNYFWMVPFDIDGLIQTIGGKNFAEKRLDRLFERLDARYEDKWFASGNEPDFHVPWIYNWTNAPKKTSLTVNRILDTMYNSSSSGLPGNDDLGTMGAWYVFASIGLYPFIPGVGGFTMNLPQYDKIKIALQDNTLEILKSKSKFDYVKSVSINNLNHNSNWIDFEKISNGGKIIFNQNIDDKSINTKTKLSN